MKLMFIGVVSSSVLNVAISFQTNLWVIAILWGLNGFCQAMVWSNGGGLLTWIPTYFTEQYNLSVKDGIFSSILLPVGQACAMFVFPFITDKIFKGKREPMLALAAVIAFLGLITFPFIKTQAPATIMLFIVGVFSMVTGVIWAVAGDMGGRIFSSTIVGVLDWAVYMGAAIQASVFGFVKSSFGWSAVFITIGCLYIILLILTLVARKMKLRRI